MFFQQGFRKLRAMKAWMSHPLLYAVLCTLLIACKKDGLNNTGPWPDDASVANVISNFSYGDSAWQKADVYLPANRSSTATGVLILVHGGSWIAGDKQDLAFLIPAIQKALPNVAVVNTNYRLANGQAHRRYDGQLADLHHLVEQLKQQSAGWFISNRLSMAGISSGGHLVLSFANEINGGNSSLRGVASVSGPTDLTADAFTKTVGGQLVTAMLMGSNYLANTQGYVNASPLFQIEKGNLPPTLLVHGTIDNLVPYQQAEQMYNALKLRNAQAHKLVTLPNEGHEITASGTAAAIAAIARAGGRCRIGPASAD